MASIYKIISDVLVKPIYVDDFDKAIKIVEKYCDKSGRTDEWEATKEDNLFVHTVLCLDDYGTEYEMVGNKVITCGFVITEIEVI